MDPGLAGNLLSALVTIGVTWFTLRHAARLARDQSEESRRTLAQQQAHSERVLAQEQEHTQRLVRELTGTLVRVERERQKGAAYAALLAAAHAASQNPGAREVLEEFARAAVVADALGNHEVRLALRNVRAQLEPLLAAYQQPAMGATRVPNIIAIETARHQLPPLVRSLTQAIEGDRLGDLPPIPPSPAPPA